MRGQQNRRRGLSIEDAILQALTKGPKTCLELQQRAHASQTGVRNALRRLEEAQRIKPVLGWLSGDRRFLVYGWARLPMGDR